jgi:hypothetical protein
MQLNASVFVFGFSLRQNDDDDFPRHAQARDDQKEKETACSDCDRLPELVCPPGRWEDAVWEEDESEEQEGAEEGGGGSSR